MGDRIYCSGCGSNLKNDSERIDKYIGSRHPEMSKPKLTAPDAMLRTVNLPNSIEELIRELGAYGDVSVSISERPADEINNYTLEVDMRYPICSHIFDTLQGLVTYASKKLNKEGYPAIIPGLVFGNTTPFNSDVLCAELRKPVAYEGGKICMYGPVTGVRFVVSQVAYPRKRYDKIRMEDIITQLKNHGIVKITEKAS